MGLTFKENCPDIRNSGVKSVIKYLIKNGCKLDLYDPMADVDEIKNIYGIYPKLNIRKNYYDGILIAVAHSEFKKMGIELITKFCKKKDELFMI